MPATVLATSPPISGPNPPNILARVAKGAYSEIVQIIAPASASAGELVEVEVRVKNLCDYNIWLSVTGRYNGIDIFFSPEYASVDPGVTYPFTGSFIMPNEDIRLEVWSFYWTGTEWYQDDYDRVNISLSAVWQKLATKTVTITPIMEVWQKLATKTVTITPVMEVWQRLATKTITITPEVPEEWTKLVTETITITPKPVEEVEYGLVYEKLYEPEASTYVGKAEICTMYFDALPEEIPGLDIIIETISRVVAEQIIAKDGVMLALRIYNAKGEWYNSRWKIEVTIHSSPFPWAVVVPLIVVLLIVIGVAYIFHEIRGVDWGKAALPVLAIILGIGAATGLAIALTRKKKTEKIK